MVFFPTKNMHFRELPQLYVILVGGTKYAHEWWGTSVLFHYTKWRAYLVYLGISWRITSNSIVNCGCLSGPVYSHGRVQWLVFVTTIMNNCSVKEGGLLG